VAFGEPVIDPLLDALDTQDQVAQAGIVAVLQRLGAKAVPQLIAALGSPSQIVQGGAINTLVQIGDPAIGPLIQTLDGSDRQVSGNAAAALKRLGPDALPALKEAATQLDSNLYIRLLVAELDQSPFTAVEDDLAAALGSCDQAAAAQAIDATLRYGDSALPMLRRLMGDPDPWRQQNSTNALILVSPTSIPILIDALSDVESQTVQQNAIRALIAIGPPARKPVQQATKSSDPYMSQNAKAVLAEA
jgi:HEAT repeat protein